MTKMFSFSFKDTFYKHDKNYFKSKSPEVEMEITNINLYNVLRIYLNTAKTDPELR